MDIPFVDFRKEYALSKEAIEAAVRRVFASGYYILGPELESFELRFAQYIGTKHMIGVANGMEALQISLMALGIGPGDEVITTSLSAAATALAIRAVGAQPVFADIDAHYHLDANAVRDVISARTKVIIPVHLYGQPADIQTMGVLAQEYGLTIIEDCAQAHGASLNGIRVGNFGNAAAFSFYPTKNLGAYGDGGSIATNDDSLAYKIRMIRNYGQSNRYEHPILGLNSRLDELQAAILSVKLERLDVDNARRKAIANRYREFLEKERDVRLPAERGASGHVYHLFVIATDRRNDLQEYLRERGIVTHIHYPIPIHKQQSFSEFNSLSLRRTEEAARSILSLPCHPFLTDMEIACVCGHIRQFFAR